MTVGGLSGQRHYIRPNTGSSQPSCWVYLDCESRTDVTGPGVSTQTFRLAVTAHDCRNHHTNGPRATEWVEHATPEALWRWVDAKAQKGKRCVLVAHNLAYDLRIAQALTWLPALGWEVKLIRLDRGSAWASWRNGRKTLVMVDSLAWAPAPLERWGELVGLSKLPLPDDDDPPGLWWARCRRDVEILRLGWQELMGWLADNDMGHWKPTGAGQGWAAFRHRFYRHRMLVHHDDDAHAAEVVAAWTGRTEAWRWGLLPAGEWTEWDWSAAYARIAASVRVPVRFRGLVAEPSLKSILGGHRALSWLCEVDVETDVPTLPCRTDAGVVWPVGRFTTTVWHPELRLAARHGADITVRRCWMYTATDALADWGAWILDVLDGKVAGIDGLTRLMVKHWSRAVIGRFAAQWSSWEDFGVAPSPDVVLSKLRLPEQDRPTRLLTLGGRQLVEGPATPGPDWLPQVTGFIASCARVRLWETMERAGLANVAYVDTDSVIVNSAGSSNLKSWHKAGLVQKGAWDAVEVLGPRQLILDGWLRAAGVPRGAERVSDRSWEADFWSTLAGDLGSGNADRVSVQARRVSVRGKDFRRRHLPGGLTSPVIVSEGSQDPVS